MTLINKTREAVTSRASNPRKNSTLQVSKFSGISDYSLAESPAVARASQTIVGDDPRLSGRAAASTLQRPAPRRASGEKREAKVSEAGESNAEQGSISRPGATSEASAVRTREAKVPLPELAGQNRRLAWERRLTSKLIIWDEMRSHMALDAVDEQGKKKRVPRSPEHQEALESLPATMTFCGSARKDVDNVAIATKTLLLESGDTVSKAHMQRLVACHNMAACPVCSSAIRRVRAIEIGKAVKAHQAEEKDLIFVTLTVKHNDKDPLALTLDAVQKGWQNLLKSRGYRKLKDKYGIIGAVRATETQLGGKRWYKGDGKIHGAGWHPHAHGLIFLDQKLAMPEEARAEFERELIKIWRRECARNIGKMPDEDHGIDCQIVDKKGEIVGRYLSKVLDEDGENIAKSWDVGAELARGDLKHRAKSLHPFQILDSQTLLDTQVRAEYWLEYVRAVKGRRLISWSRGLKARYRVQELTDEELLQQAEAQGLTRYEASTEDYEKLFQKSPWLVVRVLELAEAEDWEAIQVLLPGNLLIDAQELPQAEDQLTLQQQERKWIEETKNNFFSPPLLPLCLSFAKTEGEASSGAKNALRERLERARRRAVAESQRRPIEEQEQAEYLEASARRKAQAIRDLLWDAEEDFALEFTPF